MRKVFALLIFAVMFSVSIFAQSKTTDNKSSEQAKKAAKKANKRPVKETNKDDKSEPFDNATVELMATKCVSLKTDRGTIKLEMYPKSAPESVRNFLNLVATKALDTTTFSRVVPNFVIQGGDLYTSLNLTDKLRWRAVENIPDEPNDIKHVAGVISMARGDEPNSASTSFFILVSASSYLDNKFAGFGRVTSGLEVVRAINNLPVEGETPKDPVRIETASIVQCTPNKKS